MASYFCGNHRPTGLILFSYQASKMPRGMRHDPLYQFASDTLSDSPLHCPFGKAWMAQNTNVLEQPIRITKTIFLVPNRIYEKTTQASKQHAASVVMSKIAAATSDWELRDEVFMVPWAWHDLTSKEVMAETHLLSTSTIYQFYKRIDLPFVKQLIKEMANV